ncbi:MAG: hypothetical protein PW792_14170 [Acidobacteriaceae bacterium]|nr:hypothetical protein [Acidobacteriaceae bacterium]
MNSFPKPFLRKTTRSKITRAALLASATALAATAVVAHADFPAWMQSVVSASAIEDALFRAMQIPHARTLYPRPPAEAKKHLDSLLSSKSNEAELYALRAHTEEQALDFSGAERDWKAFVEHSASGQAKMSARFELASYYERRNQAEPQIAALEAAASEPSPATESFQKADTQAAWHAYERALSAARTQGLGDDALIAIHRARIARYPQEPAARAALLKELLRAQRFADAQQLIDEYKTAFPADTSFPLRASALLAFDQNTPDATQRALALFDQSFAPLWDATLVQSYSDLLTATHHTHAAIADARARLLKNPDDLRSAALLFDLFAQSGKLDTAINTLAQYASSKQQRKAAWTPDELYTFATLLDRAHQPADAARFAYALASSQGKLSGNSATPEEAGLAALIHLLLANSETPIALGSGNLSILFDIAQTDRGPGYLNGVLSLWMNSVSPASEFRSEEAQAVPYFHRAKAAELLQVLDTRFPQSSQRAELHAALIHALQIYSQDDAVLQQGKQFLEDFPQSPARLEIALTLADIDARKNDTKSEFALYDKLLAELGAKLNGYPLTAASSASQTSSTADASPIETPPAQGINLSALQLEQSLNVPVATPAAVAIGQQYKSVLDRYLSRLTSAGQIAAALELLRHELDRNPNDPQMYERLAEFLQQNNLADQQEAVYQQAISRFGGTGFYDKLARFYLRQRKQTEFDALSRRVVDIFRGTELESYFANVNRTWPQEYLELNIYAHERFPHDLVFVRNLLNAYQTRDTADSTAYEVLLRQHWQDTNDLHNAFFEMLSHSGRMDDERSQLQALLPNAKAASENPAAARELAEIQLWQSHFETAAPLLSQLADQYPADISVGEQAVSVFRSLAYLDPQQVQRAATIAQHLVLAEPTNLDRLATVGDIFADSTNPSLGLDPAKQIAQAAPFWQRMPSIQPGIPDGYLQAATIFWDYFQFDDALGQINAARAHFHSPSLYAYQAGAIYENQHDESKAVAEYVAAVTAPDATETNSAEARQRLLTLANRPVTAALIESLTAQAVASNPTLASLSLRADVLTAKGHAEEIAEPTTRAIAQAKTSAQLAELASFAADHTLPALQVDALQREASLTTDPAERIVLQYQVAGLYVDQHDTAAAQRVIDTTYATNSKLIGVVRSTVDFDWNHGQQARAVSILLEASHAANATLAHDFLLEAIDKSNHSGDYAGARKLLQPLLAADRFNPLYLNLQAQSFSLAHDDAGVRDLYVQTLQALKESTFAAPEKRNKTALFRQSLIPALSNLKDYPAAMEQHIALLSAFPEDASTLQNAISYAREHHREEQFLNFLKQTTVASPRDSRFFIDLAQVDVAFGDNTGALDAYSKAIAIRADRSDLFIARAELEERSQNYDAACADYERIFHLTYNDPQWMEKSALARARQGKPDLAVTALKAAYLDGRKPTAAANFTVARQLADWNLLPQANTFAAKAVELAGDDLVAGWQYNSDALFYVTLLARQRRAAEAIATVTHLRDNTISASSFSPHLLAEQAGKQGIAAVANAEWRRRQLEARKQAAISTYAASIRTVAEVAARLYTPEEQTTFATWLDGEYKKTDTDARVHIWIPAAAAANFKGREAAWRRDILLHAGGDTAAAQLSQYNDLEVSRMNFASLAETLDTYAAQLSPRDQPSVLSLAAKAWKQAANPQREAADLQTLVVRHNEQAMQERLFELYLHGDTSALIALAGSSNRGLADAVTNFTLAHGEAKLTMQALAAIPNRNPVWHSATRALAGMYLDQDPAATTASFDAALGSQSIEAQLAHHPDKQQQLVGEPWFNYSSRFGLFLALKPQPAHESEDFIPAVLEQAPSDPASYNALAGTYLEAHNLAAAITEYRHALELAPEDPTPLASIARAQMEAGHRDEALSTYREALSLLRALVDTHTVPEAFWTTFASIASDADAYKLGNDLRPSMNAVLVAYLRKNGTYRAEELLQSAWDSSSSQDSQSAMTWILALIHEIPADERYTELDWVNATLPLSNAQKDLLFRTQLALLRSTNASSQSYQLQTLLHTYALWLLKQHRTADAATLLQTVAAAKRNDDNIADAFLLLAAQQSNLPALLERFLTSPADAPSLSTLSSTANTLRLQKDYANGRLLLEFVFARKLEQGEIEDADYLALAQSRLDNNDLPAALSLLHTFTDQGDFYANLDQAASLLERSNRPAEAIAFLKPLAQGSPWNAATQIRLANALKASHSNEAETTLTAVAANQQSPYELRAEAALSLSSLSKAKHFEAAELTWLASSNRSAAELPANFVYARFISTQTAAPDKVISVLRETILSAPASIGEAIRLRLFQAYASSGHNSAARTAIEPVLSAHPSLLTTSTTSDSDDSTANEDTTTAAPASPTLAALANPFSFESQITSPAAQAELLLTLAEVDRQTSQPSLAIRDLQAALELPLSAARASKIRAQIDELQAAEELKNLNIERRPVIQPSVTQTASVRPRLTALPEVRQ